MSETRYHWQVLRAGKFKLDAGSMFGLIPRSVWSRTVPIDDKHRMDVQHNCLLLRREGTAGAGPKVILIEAGTGDKLDAKSRDIFALEETDVEKQVIAAGVDPGHVEAAVVSHLHFDHAGGLTRLVQPGESAEWTGPASGMAGSRPDHGVRRTFQNAVIIAQQREWADAIANRSVMTRTYFTDHLAPLESHLRLVDSPAPFSPGTIPDRDAPPQLPQEARETEVLPGIFVFRVPGHTWGQQAVRFVAADGRNVVFTPDVMPTAFHVGAAYSLGYDVEPYTSMVSRTWFLREAAEQNWTLVLDHEPGDPVRTVVSNGKGWWDLKPLAQN